MARNALHLQTHKSSSFQLISVLLIRTHIRDAAQIVSNLQGLLLDCRNSILFRGSPRLFPKAERLSKTTCY